MRQRYTSSNAAQQGIAITSPAAAAAAIQLTAVAGDDGPS